MIKPVNLLIVRTDRIGDVVLSLPLAGIVKEKYPESRVTFLVRKYTRSLTIKNKSIDESIEAVEYNGKFALWDNVKIIRAHKFDTCIVVSPTFKITLAIFLSGIKNRIGTGFRWYSFLFNNKLFEHRKYAEKHELEYNVNLLQFFGINKTISLENVSYGLETTENNNRSIESKLSSWGINNSKPNIIIHPGSGGSAVDLPVSKWKELIALISKELSVNLIVTGNEKEKALSCEILGNYRYINAAGELNLGELTALISKSKLLIANSTGPIHIAAALDKVVIGFYPKIRACSPERWAPYTKKRVIFTPSINCSNCTREQCLKLNCMDSIDIFNVFMEIKKIINGLNSGDFNA